MGLRFWMPRLAILAVLLVWLAYTAAVFLDAILPSGGA